MDAQEINKARIRRWIGIGGGEISRNRLRRYRPRKIAWEPIEAALTDLIAAGEVVEYRNDLEALERGFGPAATLYRLTNQQ